MFVSRISIDQWSGLHCSETVIEGPKIDQLIQFFDLLDAKTHTIITLDGQDGSSLTIGGGNGCYVIFLTSSEGDFLNLQSEAHLSEDVVMINIGGQEGDYRPDQILGKDETLNVIKFYAEHGKADPSHLWVE